MKEYKSFIMGMATLKESEDSIRVLVSDIRQTRGRTKAIADSICISSIELISRWIRQSNLKVRQNLYGIRRCSSRGFFPYISFSEGAGASLSVETSQRSILPN